jgi:penicillin-binding protein 1A
VKELNYFAEEVRRQIESRYGRDGLYKEGLKIYTSLEPEAQKLAEKALLKGLREIDRRHSSYRGPQRFVPKEEWPAFIKGLEDRNREADHEDLLEALITGFDPKAKGWELELGSGKGFLPASETRWAQGYLQSPGKNFKPGDVIWVDPLQRDKDGIRLLARLDQRPQVQGAIISMAPDSGRVIAMVGGRDFEQSQFNRATQAVRQPGSSFKPIVYSAALDKGYTLASTLIDSPFVKDDHSLQGPWAPENYDHRFWGPMLLRTALVHSRNVVTVKLMDDIGVNYVVNYARRLGIQSTLWPNLTLALGASAVTLSEMMTAYSVFANHGERSKPYLIEKVTDRYGNVLEEHQVQRESVISPQTAYLITNILQGVVEEGTGTFAKRLGRPAAGKTGTTNELKDAWFMGYTPSLLTGVWVGYDDNRKTLGGGETGGHAACPIWVYFMESWLKDKPVEAFPIPSGIVFQKVGGALMAFAEDRMPTQSVAKGDQTPAQEQELEPGLEQAQTPPEGGAGTPPPANPPSNSSSSFFKSDLF